MPRMKKTTLSGGLQPIGSKSGPSGSLRPIGRGGKSASGRGFRPPGGGGGRMSSPTQRKRAATKGRTMGGLR
jgi:hypothetical protein